jgi:hypothetical protein
MTQYWKYTICMLALAACSEKRPASDAQSAVRQPPVTDTAKAAAPATTRASTYEHLQTVAVAADDVPAAQRLPGKLLEAWRWEDANGENLLVIYRAAIPSRNERRAQTDPAWRKKLADPKTATSAEDDGRGAQLLVRQYVRKQGAYTELWRLQDSVSDCPVDLILGPASNSTTVTDLDRNGQSETTVLYALGCRGDVSPDDLKLVMHEGTAKYALRGFTVVQFDSIPARQRQPTNPCCLGELSKTQLAKLYDGPTEGYMGRYFSEADFKAKADFLHFARHQWQQYSIFDAAQAQVE